MTLSEWLEHVASPTTEGGAEQFARGADLRAIEARDLEAEVERLRAVPLHELAEKESEHWHELNTYRAAVAELRKWYLVSGATCTMTRIFDSLPRDEP